MAKKYEDIGAKVAALEERVELLKGWVEEKRKMTDEIDGVKNELKTEREEREKSKKEREEEKYYWGKEVLRVTSELGKEVAELKKGGTQDDTAPMRTVEGEHGMDAETSRGDDHPWEKLEKMQSELVSSLQTQMGRGRPRDVSKTTFQKRRERGWR